MNSGGYIESNICFSNHVAEKQGLNLQGIPDSWAGRRPQINLCLHVRLGFFCLLAHFLPFFLLNVSKDLQTAQGPALGNLSQAGATQPILLFAILLCRTVVWNSSALPTSDQRICCLFLLTSIIIQSIVVVFSLDILGCVLFFISCLRVLLAYYSAAQVPFMEPNSCQLCLLNSHSSYFQ